MTEVCKRFLPDHVLDCKSSLVSALAGAFGVSEDDLQLQVRDLCITPDRELQDAIALWLDQYHLTWKQYLSHVVNKNVGADGLFVWL